MADFNFHLNRQGPVGKKGEKGEKGKDGNTPIFSEGTNTATEYTLLIDYGDGNIGQTGNLRPPVTNEGGTYVRYNTQTGTYEINEADIADLNRTQGEVTLASVQDVINETALDTDAVSFELRNQDLEDINEDIEALDEKVDGIDDRLDTAEDNISQAQQDIVNLDNRVENLDGRVTTNEGAIEQAQSNITSLQTGKANVVHTHTISQITDAGALASQNVVDYQSQVINKPTIPTVGDGTITITQGGVAKGTFTTNQSGNSTIELDAGGASFTAGTGLELTNQDVLNVKIDGSTITTNADGELVASGGTTLTAGDGITIDQDNEISVNVDNDTIIIDGNSLKANIPDVSNFVTDTQLANTLEAYPTNQALSNLVDYETETETTFGQPISYANTDITGIGVSDYEAADSMMGFITIDVHYDGPANSTRTVEISNITDPNNPDIGYVKVGRAFSSLADIYFPTGTESFYITGKTLTGEDISFSSDDLPAFATYDSVEYALTFSEPIYVWSVEFYPLTAEGAVQSVRPRIHAYPNGIGGYAYNNQTSTVTTTKAVVADTAVDGITIDIDSNGQLTYIGTTGDTLPSQTGNSGKFLTTDGSVTSWATVSQPDMTQYYTKTQTDTLLGAKITGGAVQYPLFYQPDTTSSVKLNNISPISLTGSADNGYTSDNNSLTNPVFNIKDFTNNDYKNVADYPELLDQSELCYAEYELKNGINTQFYSGGQSSSSGVYAGVAGYYDNGSFIPTILLYPGCSGYTYYRHIVFTETPSVFTGGNAYQMSSSSTIMALGDDLTNCAASIVSTSGGNGWVIGFTTEEKELIDRSTHFRVMGIGTSQGATTTINLNTYKAVNPTFSEQWCPTSGGSSSTWAAYENSTNIFNVHPESLSLKYDSNTLGVNANNELTVPTATTSNLGLVQPDGSTITINNGVISAAGSTPSNMVTTDTSQTISGTKTFSSNLYLQDGINQGGRFYSSSTGMVSYKSASSSHNGTISFSDGASSWVYSPNSVGIQATSDYSAINLSDQYYVTKFIRYNNKFVIENTSPDTKIYRLNTESSYPTSPTNFLLEKDMLDGTTLTYDNSTHKISAASSAPIRKTITQASANISESSGTVTVTDTDVTTSTMVTLYPSDTITEDWLANNLASNIITEGTGSFTFTINGTLPATFSMYYIIQEVS